MAPVCARHRPASRLRAVCLPAAVVIVRALAGLVVAAVIAAAARRARMLSRSGTVAAIAVGTACIAAGWSWGALLIAFFTASSLLSRLGSARKAGLTERIVEK